jgi:hypothetical protein
MAAINNTPVMPCMNCLTIKPIEYSAYITCSTERIHKWITKNDSGADALNSSRKGYTIFMSYTTCDNVHNAIEVPDLDYMTSKTDRRRFLVARVMIAMIKKSLETNIPSKQIRLYATKPFTPSLVAGLQVSKQKFIYIGKVRHFISQMDVLDFDASENSVAIDGMMLAGTNTAGLSIQEKLKRKLSGMWYSMDGNKTINDPGILSMDTQKLYVQCAQTECKRPTRLVDSSPFCSEPSCGNIIGHRD